MAKQKPHHQPLTFEEAVGRVFEFNHYVKGRRRFYVVRGYKTLTHVPVVGKVVEVPRVIDLETSQEVMLSMAFMSFPIPAEWKEILP